MSDDLVSLSPVNFFQFSLDCCFIKEGDSFPFFDLTKKELEKYLLPDTSSLCGEDSFSKFYMGWNKGGIYAKVIIDQPFKESNYPKVTDGDSVELFFDTRDVKTSGYNTRFCHHFYFLPEAVEGHQAGEITHFRTEERHELCDPQELKVKYQSLGKTYSIEIFIPSQCLNGYDPEQFNRMGFTYRVNRFHGKSQHFSVVSEDYQLEQQPSLWSSLRLIK